MNTNLTKVLVLLSLILTLISTFFNTISILYVTNVGFTIFNSSLLLTATYLVIILEIMLGITAILAILNEHRIGKKLIHDRVIKNEQ